MIYPNFYAKKVKKSEKSEKKPTPYHRDIELAAYNTNTK